MDEELRLREPNRKQLILQPVDYATLIDAEHPARAIWRVLEGLAVGRVCAPIKARENRPRRDATSPPMLLGRWRNAVSEGGASAGEIARLGPKNAAYPRLSARWSLNHT